jgi:hypothetical protein
MDRGERWSGGQLSAGRLWSGHLSAWDRACTYRGHEKRFDSSPLLGPMCVSGRHVAPQKTTVVFPGPLYLF